MNKQVRYWPFAAGQAIQQGKKEFGIGTIVQFFADSVVLQLKDNTFVAVPLDNIQLIVKGE